MSKNETLIPIVVPYTLNKKWDPADPQRPSGTFWELENYIPIGGIIESREGIIALAHTPETTVVVPFPESGTYTPPWGGTYVCRMVLKFESNPIIGFNYVSGATGINPVMSGMTIPEYTGEATCVGGPATPKEGVGSLYISTANNTPYCGTPARSYGMQSRPGPLLPSWLFPGVTSAEFRTILITYWVYPIVVTNTDDQHVSVRKVFGGSSQYAWYQAHESNDYQMAFANSAQTGFTKNLTGAMPSANQWYFCAAWVDFTNSNYGLYCYDDVAKTEQWDAANGALNVAHHLYNAVTSNVFTLGGYRAAEGSGWSCAGSAAMRGHLDYLTYWDGIPTVNSSVVTLVREIRDLHKA